MQNHLILPPILQLLHTSYLSQILAIIRIGENIINSILRKINKKKNREGKVKELGKVKNDIRILIRLLQLLIVEIRCKLHH